MDLFSWRRYLAPVITGMVIVFILGYGIVLFYRSNMGYEVNSVPYSGIRGVAYQQHLYTGTNSRVRAVQIGSAGASVIMATGHWRVKDNAQKLILPADVTGTLPAFDTSHTLEDIAQVAEEFGYSAKIRSVPFGVWGLGMFSHKNRLTPLIVEQDLAKDTPGKGKIFRVIVGVTPGADEVIVHDYAYGPSVKMSSTDFEALWRDSKRVLIIEPKDRDTADQAQSIFAYQPYSFSAELHDLRTNWYLAEEARAEKQYKEAIAYWEKVVANEEFVQSPASRQLYHFQALLFMLFQDKAFEKMVSYESKVIAVNKTQGNFKEQVQPWVLLGEGFLGVGNKVQAKQYAEKALAINKDAQAAQSLLERSN